MSTGQTKVNTDLQSFAAQTAASRVCAPSCAHLLRCSELSTRAPQRAYPCTTRATPKLGRRPTYIICDPEIPSRKAEELCEDDPTPLPAPAQQALMAIPELNLI